MHKAGPERDFYVDFTLAVHICIIRCDQAMSNFPLKHLLVLHQPQLLSNFSPLDDFLTRPLASVLFRFQSLHQHASVEESICKNLR
jgi:hypothetical protein